MEATKTCIKCGIIEELNKFKKGKRVCKKCINKQSREWRAVNKDKTRKQRARYLEKHLDVEKKWRDKNKDKMREYNKKWREKKEREFEIQAAQILANLCQL
ncbi:Hypothetical protein PACV_301 [Pacmanvirus A23]|uniref:Hypothetical protein n=1 Tax=Pacmanvirus A23 TaxID=1932881 RepID=UPI000A095A6A|nr:Hypothetical protein B9W72_gp297 [Pacmanvirus A23]SIP86014.1 Hypothetical protein PACV_301 [Pacmanvirus A23]